MKVLFLLLMLLSSGVYGQGEYSLHPNLESQKFLYLAKGTQIIPLCNPYLPPSCFHQWVAKAQPLTLTSDETRRSMIQFYLPGLINLEERRVSNTEGDLTKKGWRRLEEISDDNIRYYQKLNSPRIREFRSEGNQSSVREGDLVYVSENDINVLEVSRTQEKTNSEQPSRKNQKKRDTISVKTKRTSYALEGELSKTKTLPEGCVVIDKQQEASSCMECNIRDLNIVKTDEQITKLKVLLEGVEKGYTGTFKGKKRKVAGSRRSIKGKKIVIEKICSPQESLRSIIENFNRSCTPNRFKTFFQELYCRSCKSRIPPEVMLAMMTIESAGVCQAENYRKGEERSLGLFQINADVHSCKGNRPGTEKNRQCFLDLENNMYFGVDHLKEKYQDVNASKMVERLKADACPMDWSTLSETRRDSWRRAVSAYNAQPKWIDRAIQTVENVKPEVGTKKLDRRGGNVAKGASQLSDVPWRRLRLYYFAEKFLSAPNEKMFGETGRATINTVSNIAHTEAVLGRELKGSLPGAVEFWEQYIKENRPECSK